MHTIYPPDLQAKLDQMRSRAKDAASKVTDSFDDLPPEFTSAQAILVRLLLTEPKDGQSEEEWQRTCDYCSVVAANTEDLYFNELTAFINDEDFIKPVYAQVGIGTCRRCSLYLRMYDNLARIERVMPGMKEANEFMLKDIQAMHHNLENVDVERVLLAMRTIDQIADSFDDINEDNRQEKLDASVEAVLKMLEGE